MGFLLFPDRSGIRAYAFSFDHMLVALNAMYYDIPLDYSRVYFFHTTPPVGNSRVYFFHTTLQWFCMNQCIYFVMLFWCSRVAELKPCLPPSFANYLLLMVLDLICIDRLLLWPGACQRVGRASMRLVYHAYLEFLSVLTAPLVCTQVIHLFY